MKDGDDKIATRRAESLIGIIDLVDRDRESWPTCPVGHKIPPGFANCPNCASAARIKETDRLLRGFAAHKPKPRRRGR